MSDPLGPHGLQYARLPYGILKPEFIKSEQIDGCQKQVVGGGTRGRRPGKSCSDGPGVTDLGP